MVKIIKTLLVILLAGQSACEDKKKEETPVAQPRLELVNAIKLESAPQDISINGKYAALVLNSKVVIMGLENPELPTKVGEVEFGNYISKVSFVGDYVYVFDAQLGMGIINARDLTAPKSEARLTLTVIDDAINDMQGLMVGESRFLLAASEINGVLAYDLSVAGEPLLVESLGNEAPQLGKKLLVDGSYIYLNESFGESSILTYQIDEAGSLEALGAFTLGAEVSGDVAGISKYGSYLLVSALAGGLHVLDVENPREPAWLATYESELNVKNTVVVRGGEEERLAVISSNSDENYVIDIVKLDPDAANVFTLEYAVRVTGKPNQVSVYEGILYVLNSEGLLETYRLN